MTAALLPTHHGQAPSAGRRRFVGSLLAAGAAAPFSRLGWAAPSAEPTAPRLVLVVLRGGLDGLAAVPVPGDPSFAPSRGALAEFAQPALPLSGPFALHPSLPQLHALYQQGEALVVHATGLPYRERSHFDAQQVLESGGARPHELDTGWLARALAADRRRGIALNTAVPLVLRGPGEIDTWSPSNQPDPSADLISRLERIYSTDPALARALGRARGLRQDPQMPVGGDMAAMQGAGRPVVIGLARKAAEFIGQPTGPQVAVLEMNGWDTHVNQTAPNGVLANNLRTLDAALAALREGLIASGTWSRTAVVVATEFGREVAINGTQGTDHGSGGAAFVLGGAVAGGRVLADWPGLARQDRYEGRDLRITTDLRAVFKGVLHDHLKLSAAALSRDVFPGSEAIRPMGLFRG